MSAPGGLELEAREIAGKVVAGSLPFRFFGGLAVLLRQPDGGALLFERQFQDIDLMAIAPKPKQVIDFARSLGYAPDHAFNVVNGRRRLIFYNSSNWKLEFFLNSFEMCHRIPMDRALLEPVTIPLAELILTKLQIVRMTEKDVHDALQLLYAHDVGSIDGDSVNAVRVAECCAGDWGLWRTVTLNLERCIEMLPRETLSSDQASATARRLAQVRSFIDAAPKSVGWRLRSRVGDRLPWYDEPDEV